MANTVNPKDTVIFTTSYGKNKKGLQPIHIIDIVPESVWQTGTYDLSGIGSMHNPPNTNFTWRLWSETVGTMRSSNYSYTGRKKYKMQKVV